MIRYSISLFVAVILNLSLLFTACAAQANMSFNLSQYMLGSGDVIQIKVFGQSDLLLKTRLSNDGMINYPLLGEISVVGMTANELEIYIYKGLLGDYLVNPSVAVSIEEYRPFFIDGEVNRPGGYPYQPGLTIDKAAALAGGYTQRASKTEVEVIREIGGIAQAIEVNATQFIFPGDSIKVKKTFF
jgi:protein involved in polysaccharide export with SLBB domain